VLVAQLFRKGGGDMPDGGKYNTLSLLYRKFFMQKISQKRDPLPQALS